WQKEPAKDDCANYAAFKKARAAQDSALCGDKGVCRAMMGRGLQGCEPYLKKIKGLFCADLESALGAARASEGQTRFRVRLDLANSKLKEAREQVGRALNVLENIEPRSLPGIKERSDAARALNQELDASLKRLKPFETPAPEGKGKE